MAPEPKTYEALIQQLEAADAQWDQAYADWQKFQKEGQELLTELRTKQSLSISDRDRAIQTSAAIKATETQRSQAHEARNSALGEIELHIRGQAGIILQSNKGAQTRMQQGKQAVDEAQYRQKVLAYNQAVRRDLAAPPSYDAPHYAAAHPVVSATTPELEETANASVLSQNSKIIDQKLKTAFQTIHKQEAILKSKPLEKQQKANAKAAIAQANQDLFKIRADAVNFSENAFKQKKGIKKQIKSTDKALNKAFKEKDTTEITRLQNQLKELKKAKTTVDNAGIKFSATAINARPSGFWESIKAELPFFNEAPFFQSRAVTIVAGFQRLELMHEKKQIATEKQANLTASSQPAQDPDNSLSKKRADRLIQTMSKEEPTRAPAASAASATARLRAATLARQPSQRGTLR